MATHHGKDAVVHIGGTNIGQATGFTIDTTHDIVEDTALGSSMKSYVVGRGTFTASIDMNFDDDDTAQNTLTQGASVSVEFMPEGFGFWRTKTIRNRNRNWNECWCNFRWSDY